MLFESPESLQIRVLWVGVVPTVWSCEAALMRACARLCETTFRARTERTQLKPSIPVKSCPLSLGRWPSPVLVLQAHYLHFCVAPSTRSLPWCTALCGSAHAWALTVISAHFQKAVGPSSGVRMAQGYECRPSPWLSNYWTVWKR